MSTNIIGAILVWAAPVALLLIIAIRFVQIRRRRKRRAPADSPTIRRRDRSISDPTWIERILADGYICRIALSGPQEPYIVPLNYGVADPIEGRITYDRRNRQFRVGVDQVFRLYFHSAVEGRKIDMLKHNPRVCFEIEGRSEVRAAPEPCDWTIDYESIIGYGTLSIVDDPEEKADGLRHLMWHQGAEGPMDFTHSVVARTCVLRLDVLELSGKSNLDATAPAAE